MKKYTSLKSTVLVFVVVLTSLAPDPVGGCSAFEVIPSAPAAIPNPTLLIRLRRSIFYPLSAVHLNPELKAKAEQRKTILARKEYNSKITKTEIEIVS